MKKRDLPLIGLVLTGGKSLRMGQAKAHLSYSDRPQWQVCEEILLSCCGSVYFASSPNLSPALPVHQEKVISDIFVPSIGPLGGIMSAFKKIHDHGIFVLACDLPNFSQQAAAFLVSARNSQKKATTFAIKDIEPLAAIYEPEILSDLAIFWAKGVYCPRAILSSLDVAKVIPREERWLINVNHQRELENWTRKSTEKLVRICYFSSLREQTGVAEESLMTAASSMAELFNELKKKYGFRLDMSFVRFAKNDLLVQSNEPIANNDEIVFLPPVSGG